MYWCLFCIQPGHFTLVFRLFQLLSGENADCCYPHGSWPPIFLSIPRQWVQQTLWGSYFIGILWVEHRTMAPVTTNVVRNARSTMKREIGWTSVVSIGSERGNRDPHLDVDSAVVYNQNGVTVVCYSFTVCLFGYYSTLSFKRVITSWLYIN